ncbi:MAG: IclR family transcriptional regulator [Pseudomonadota bacterium]
MSDENAARGKRKKEYSAPALEKGLDILEVLSSKNDGLTSKEISAALGKPMGQLFRMLVVLQQRGYVTYDAQSERYSLTLRIFDIANRLAPVRKLTQAATPLIRELSDTIQQSCHVVIYYDGKGHIVVQQDSPSERILVVRLGAEAPLADTCSGHVLLAYADDEQRAKMLAAIPGYHRKLSKTAAKKITERVRSAGYESIQSAQIQGVRDIGFPIFDHMGRCVAALVVPFLEYLDSSHPVKVKEARGMIQQTALLVSERLGHQ